MKSSKQDNFNPSSVSGASWVRDLERLNGSQVEYFEDFWERRVRSFLSTDDLVGGVFERLEEDGLRNDTVVIFTRSVDLSSVFVTVAHAHSLCVFGSDNGNGQGDWCRI